MVFSPSIPAFLGIWTPRFIRIMIITVSIWSVNWSCQRKIGKEYHSWQRLFFIWCISSNRQVGWLLALVSIWRELIQSQFGDEGHYSTTTSISTLCQSQFTFLFGCYALFFRFRSQFSDHDHLHFIAFLCRCVLRQWCVLLWLPLCGECRILLYPSL